jgi:hypothetical protein
MHLKFLTAHLRKNLYVRELLGLAWLGLAWLGLAWLGLAWLGLAWLGLAWLSAFAKATAGHFWGLIGSAFGFIHFYS